MLKPVRIHSVYPKESPVSVLEAVMRHNIQHLKVLGIDVGREKERDGCGSNEGIFRYKYAVGGGTKLIYGNYRYEN